MSATADLPSWFYTLLMPTFMFSYFCLKGVSADQLRRELAAEAEEEAEAEAEAEANATAGMLSSGGVAAWVAGSKHGGGKDVGSAHPSLAQHLDRFSTVRRSATAAAASASAARRAAGSGWIGDFGPAHTHTVKRGQRSQARWGVEVGAAPVGAGANSSESDSNDGVLPGKWDFEKIVANIAVPVEERDFQVGATEAAHEPSDEDENKTGGVAWDAMD